MINRTFFFSHAREVLFTGRLSQGQVNGLTHLLDAWEHEHAQQDDRWLAYALATSFHETGFTMQPVRERGGPAWYHRMYDPGSPLPARARLARSMQARPGDGMLFHGRGHVQLTWRRNYEAMGRRFGVDLCSDAEAADRVMQPALAARILFEGMREGSFTGRRLAQYFNGSTEDWKNARRIINGTDCADAIAVHARKFYSCISYTTG